MDYSANFMKEAWFEKEMQTVMELHQEGLKRPEIFDKLIDNNTFQMRSVDSVKTRFQMVYKRVEVLNDTLVNHFLNGNIYDRKAVNFYSFLKVYKLAYEFFIEVVVANYQNGKSTFQRSDFHYFFEKKELESEKVKGWRATTKKRLISSMLHFFRESGLIVEKAKNSFKVSPLHISKDLRNYAEEHDKLLLLLANLSR